MVIGTALVITSFLKQVQNVTWQLQLRQLLWEIWKLLSFLQLGECDVMCDVICHLICHTLCHVNMGYFT